MMIRRYAESNIPVEYWDLSMERDFYGDEKLKKQYYNIVGDPKCSNDYPANKNAIAITYEAGLSYCFAGTSGLGKTMVCSNILKRTCIKGYSSLYTTLSDMIFCTLHPDYSERAIARREMMSVDFLVVDEFDPRFMPSEQASDMFGRTLENVFRTRSQNKLPTLMCTNSPNVVDSFQGAIKDSLESLIKGYVKNVIVFGEDYRVSNPPKMREANR